MSEGGNSGNFYKSGDWLAVCDICGFRFKASQLKKNWKGEYVCAADFELRHPQEFVRVRPEHISVPWSRPETDAQIGPACFIWDQSAYANLAVAGCAKAGKNFPQTSIQLWNLKFQPQPA